MRRLALVVAAPLSLLAAFGLGRRLALREIDRKRAAVRKATERAVAERPGLVPGQRAGEQ